MDNFFKNNKWKIIFGILLLVVVIIGIYLYTSNYNVKEIDFGNIEKIYVVYDDSNDGDNYPTIKVEYTEAAQDDFLECMQDWKFVEYNNDPSTGGDHYTIILNDNIKFTFSYDDVYVGWSIFDPVKKKNGYVEYPCTCYYMDESFKTRIPVSLLNWAVSMIDDAQSEVIEKLIQSNNVSKITFKTSEETKTFDRLWVYSRNFKIF